jgi:predicted  nucleic acid-binding Zn-ribbon protein
VSSALELPFDQYQRYRLVADLLATLRTGPQPGPKKGGAKRASSEPLTVLDVGGRTALLRSFLPDERVTLVDLEASSEPGLVLGDGAALPFRGGSFDVVAAFDTLEHVPPKLRPKFVAECARVAKRWVVLAGPYHSKRVEQAEQILQRFLKDKLALQHRYLEEHRHHGLPSLKETEAELAALGAKVRSVGHANLERWLALMCLSMYLDHDPALRGLASSIHRFYNAALYASDHAEPVYRHLVIAALDGAQLPEDEDVLGLLEPPVAPKGALEPFTELAGELVAFDRERGEWRLERERLREMARELTSDLEGHRRTLDELGRDLELERKQGGELVDALESERSKSAEVIATLEADLGEHKKTLGELAGELEAHRETLAGLEAALEGERDAAARSIATLEQDLAGHRAQIEDLRRDAKLAREGFATELASLQADLKEHRRSLATLTSDLEGHRKLLGALRQELERERKQSAATRATLEQDLAQHRAALGETREDLSRHRTAKAELERELEGFRANQAALEAELARTQQAAQEIQAELLRSNANAEALGRTLEARGQEIADLRALLRSRWLNFKRALGPKKPDF